MNDLFDYSAHQRTDPHRPLAERMRPRGLNEFVGQVHAVGPGTLIRSAVEADRIFSMILWGPPGCGKTTLARIVAAETRCHFTSFSAVLSGVKEIRAVIETARDQHRLHHRRTVLFVDEIHRFNKAQQDAFLQHVESGLITLIGATTENPSFEVIPALLSRCRVITLYPLAHGEMKEVLQRALEDAEQGLGGTGIRFDPKALDHLIELADGDVRSALNGLEIVAAIVESGDPDGSAGEAVSLDVVEQALQKKALRYDKGGEEHFNIISALHKSLRGSDPDAALYWLARMLAAGEDPFYVARRMVRFASEDVGNADPFALTVALNAVDAYRFLGPPEGELALAQAALYLATAPKSNRIYTAYKDARKAIDQTGGLPVPVHLRNAPTRLMKEMGYGKGYRYAHDYPDAVAAQQHLPDALADRRFYRPSDRGYEKTVGQRLERWREMMSQNGSP